MTGMQIILGVLILVVLAGGAAVIGFAMTRAAKQEKPKLFLIGLSVCVAGAVLGYVVIDLFLVLEGQGR